MAKANPEEFDLEEQQAEQDREDREVSKAVKFLSDETERETFRYGADVKEEPEDDGDRSLEEPEEDISGPVPDEELQAETEEQTSDEPEQEGEPDEEPEQTPDGFVTGYRYRQERRERERLEQELADLRARQQQYQPPPQPQYQPPPQPQQPPAKPDLFVDPDAHSEWLIQQTLMRQNVQRIGASFAEAAEEYGDDYQYVFNVLNEALQRNEPAALQVQNRILSSANPGRALMRWGQDLLQERADYQDQWMREQVRDRYGIDLAELEQQQQRNSRSGQSAPRSISRSPEGEGRSNPRRQTMPSLNSAAGNGRVMQRERYSTGPLSDDDGDIFNDIFSSPRR